MNALNDVPETYAQRSVRIALVRNRVRNRWAVSVSKTLDVNKGSDVQEESAEVSEESVRARVVVQLAVISLERFPCPLARWADWSIFSLTVTCLDQKCSDLKPVNMGESCSIDSQCPKASTGQAQCKAGVCGGFGATCATVDGKLPGSSPQCQSNCESRVETYA